MFNALALIPARGGSKRVPGKNTRLLGGKPLIEWTLTAAFAARQIDRLVVSTDDDEIARIARAAGANALERPPHLSGDHASSADAAIHALDAERAAGRDWDVLCLLQPTSPFRAEGRVDAGLDMLAGRPDADAVVGAAIPEHHPLHCCVEGPGGHLAQVGVSSGNTAAAARSQDLPVAWALTGSFYAIRTEALRAHRTFLPPACLPLKCDAPGEGIDIDWPADFDRAEAHLRRANARLAVRA